MYIKKAERDKQLQTIRQSKGDNITNMRQIEHAWLIMSIYHWQDITKKLRAISNSFNNDFIETQYKDAPILFKDYLRHYDDDMLKSLRGWIRSAIKAAISIDDAAREEQERRQQAQTFQKHAREARGKARVHNRSKDIHAVQ